MWVFELLSVQVANLRIGGKWAGLAFSTVMAAFAYSLTISPTINTFDSAEFIAAAYVRGIVHAPGYPLYLLLAHAFTRLPFGNVALNVNALSALSAVGAVGFVYLIAYRLTGRAWYATFTGVLFGLTRSLWSQAVIAEVYALNALLLSAVVYMVLIWIEEPRPRSLYILCGLFGLSLTHHPSTALFGPGIIMVLVGNRASRHHGALTLLAAALCFVAPLSLYLYLPLRYAADPPFNYVAQYFWIDLRTAGGVLWMISGRMFGPSIFGVAFGEGLLNVLKAMLGYWRDLLGFGVLLIPMGAVQLYRQKQLFLIFLTSSFAGVILFFSFYDVPDADTMFLPGLLALMPLVACGLQVFWEFVEGASIRIERLVMAALVAIALLVGIFTNWQYVDYSADYSVYQYAKETMDELSQDAFVVTFWTSATPLEYMQVVEGRRPDVEIFDRGLFVLGVRDRVLRTTQVSPEHIGILMGQELVDRINLAMEEREVFLLEDDIFLRAHFCLVPLESGIYRLTTFDDSGSCET